MNVHTFILGRHRTRTYLVEDGSTSDALLIDPTEDPDGLIAAAKARGLRIVAVVATHSHYDHVGGVAGVAERLDIPFMIGMDAVGSLREEAARAAKLGVSIQKPPEPDRLLSEGDVLEIGTLQFRVLDTPGHWRGDVSLYEPNAGVVFTGDSLHRGEIGRFNAGCDEDQLRTSIETKLMVLPDETVVYSGHGPLTTIGEERDQNRGLRGLPPERRRS